jgi:hypothetical protein
LKFNQVHSDLRVCAAKEPKSEPEDLVLDVPKIDEDRQRSFKNGVKRECLAPKAIRATPVERFGWPQDRRTGGSDARRDVR